jgi:UDP-2,4-diacetamido-2,4,6-trideoxy-beta-L-altropyranose hydrolase
MAGQLTIRADANAAKGIGHLMRMIALGQAWKDAGGSVLFLGMVEATTLRKRILAEGFKLVDIDEPHPAEGDLAAVLKHTQSGAWVALDGYHFDTVYMHALRSVGRRTLVVDDANDRNEYEADILLNQNLGADGFDYLLNTAALALAGPRFALLRREFQHPGIAVVPVAENARHVLVTFGGSDPANMCQRVLESLEALAMSDLQIVVLAGAANNRLEPLRAQARGLCCDCRILHNVEDMAQHMSWADLTIGAAGSTSLELCAFGVPMLLTAVAENQRAALAALTKVGVARPFALNAQPEVISKAVEELLLCPATRQRMRENSLGLVDGKGACRVVAAIIRHSADCGPAQAAAKSG